MLLVDLDLSYGGPWDAFVVTVVLVLASAALGYRLGLRSRRRRDPTEPAVGSIVGATLGLLAFILAFTFGMAGSHYESRKRLVLEETNAIGTAVLRASLLPDGVAAGVRALFAEYVDLRLKAARGELALEEVVPRTEELQGELWGIARDAARAQPESEPISLFIQSVNEVIDLQTERIVIATRTRIPPTIWIALFLLTCSGMVGVGYHAGMAGSTQVVPLAMLVLAFATVMLLIASLDRPRESLIRVDQGPLEDLQRSIRAIPD